MLSENVAVIVTTSELTAVSESESVKVTVSDIVSVSSCKRHRR